MRSLFSALALLAATSGSVFAQAVLITSPTTVGPTDTTIAGTPLATADITVQGTTLTINGRHTIQSLVLKRDGAGGILTHAPAFTFDYSGGAGTDVVNGMSLTITGNLTVESTVGGTGGFIDVSGRGFGPDAGPGKGTPSTNGSIGGAGAGFGGNGAAAAAIGLNFAGGHAYGSITDPVDLGSGGGNYVGNLGSAGGGCVRLTVNGTASIDGSILANGAPAPGSGGAGSGGSIKLTAGTLAGAGAIRANGGSSAWGNGGGGRIAVSWTNSTYTGVFNASGPGPSSSPPGGAGTVALKPGGASGFDLVLDNASSTPASYTPLSGATSTRSIVIRNGAFAQGLDTPLTVPGTSISSFGGLNLRGGQLTINGNLSLDSFAARITGTAQVPARLTVTGNMSVDSTSFITFDAMGFPGATGPGAGNDSNNVSIGAAGGGHGGNGGDAPPFVGGTAYGSIIQPVTLGSGGGSYVGNPGGIGGGAVRIDVSGNLTLDGVLSSNGSTPNNSSGGGAGGSIWINAGTFAGAGSVVARGGEANGWGSGAGGRIAIYATSAPFSGLVVAIPGSAPPPRAGGAGTVYTKLAADALGSLRVDGQTAADIAITPITSGPAYKSVTVQNKGNLSAQMPMVTTDLAVQLAGRLELRADPLTVTGSLSMTDTGSVITGIPLVASTLNVSGNATIGAGAAISFNGLGFLADTGPGKGEGSNNGGIGGAGAGHAGLGANAQSLPGGGAYGNIATPTTFGSGGGSFVGNPGGSGGGVLRMTVGGTLACNGAIASDGMHPGSAAGAGSGGSLWITTGALAGTGVISANGGVGGSGWGAAGAGRIALYYTSNSFAGSLQAIGGSGGTGGPARAGAGTIYMKQASATKPDIIVDGPGTGDRSLLTPLTGITNARSLAIKNLANAQWASAAVIDDVTVSSAARLELGSGLFRVNNTLLVTGAGSVLTGQPLVGTQITAQNVNIATGAAVSWTGLGYSANDGPGAGTPSDNGGIGGAGGGYGGRGASSGPFPGGGPYGDAPNPFEFGSGGGSFVTSPGGAGGGFLFLDIPGVLTVNGSLECSGRQGTSAAGSGSGGSLYIKSGGITGAGTIAANGGVGGGGAWGPGGGGRIAIYACGNSLPPANVTAAKGAGNIGATDGSVVYGASSIAFDLSPTSQTFTYSQIVVLDAHATSTQPGGVTSYQWRRRNAVGVFEPIPNGDLGRFFDTNAPQMTINGATCVDANSFDCLATDACGSFPSGTAVLSIGRRFGDFDSSGGTPDATDIVAFFDAWLVGDISADVDDSGGTPDTTDITVFFQAWLDGC